jgi:hypothetical protein
MLVEVCCKCGFVHRDDRIRLGYRCYKPHYHWTPVNGARIQDGFKLHATICVGCVQESIDWAEFFEQKRLTPERYQVKGSLNAPLPEQYLATATALYEGQAQYFDFEITSVIIHERSKSDKMD